MNVFQTVLRGFWECLGTFNSFDEKKSGYVLSNYNTQSVGNRKSKFWINATMKVGKATVEILLKPGFNPTRVEEDVYNGQDMGGWGEVDDVHKDDRYNNWAIPHKESLARIAFFVENILTGNLYSGESTFKVYMLQYALDTLKPKSLTIKLYDDPKLEHMVGEITLPTLRGIIRAGYPRVEIVLNSPKKSESTVGKKPSRRRRKATPETIEY